MKTRWQPWLMAVSILLGASAVPAQPIGGVPIDAVQIEVVDDHGRPFAQYPLRAADGSAPAKAYLEATRGRNYAVQVRNRTDQRIGVVIAVDGRNIISGRRSDLRPDERMYVLGPQEQGRYEGWRTGRDRINRFYFTEAGDSYADAWGDRSALGVIAVAAFREKVPVQPWSGQGPGDTREPGRRHAPAAETGQPGGAPAMKQSEPGTGFGEQHWSPSQQIAFQVQPRPFARYFLKYAWRDTLCRQGVIDCGDQGPPPRPNRFWDGDEGYAPPPPRPYPSR